LNEYFCDEQFQQHFNDALTLVHQFVQMIVYAKNIRFDLFDYLPQMSIIHDDIILVSAQSINCLRWYSRWLKELHSSNGRYNNQEHRKIAKDLLTVIIDCCVIFIDPHVILPISMSATNLLYTLSTLIRPNYILHIPSIKELIERVIKWNRTEMSVELYTLVIKTISCLIIYPSLDDKQYSTERSEQYKFFIQRLFEPYGNLINILDNEQIQNKQVIEALLFYTNLLSDLVYTVRSENIKTKQIFFLSIHHLILSCNHLLSIVIHRNAECSRMLLSLFFSLFETIRTQMGVQLIETILKNMFNLFNINDVRTILADSEHAAHNLLSLIISEPGTKYGHFLSLIIDLNVNAIFPALRDNPSLDIRESYFNLLGILLLNNWKYFFKGNVLSTLNEEVENVENETSFMQIMESYAWSCSQTDVELFRKNLSSLEELNQKCALYNKQIFQIHMLKPFLTLLITALLAHTHNLCRDEIIAGIYHMSSHQNNATFVEFLTDYLYQQTLTDEKKNILLQNYVHIETDLPSFSKNLTNFIHDYRYYTAKI
ncbi:unnamed protein product, partial [Didymodactylos carnosus]